jgi:heme/copper-type cytochrome/quinol oxidase subunit 3
MPTLSVMFGVILTALGLVAYFNPEPLGVGKDGTPATPGHPSSLAPAVVGALLILAGVVAMAAPGARKHAMHAAAVVALLGTVGGLVPVILRNFRFEEVAVKIGLGMAVFSVIFLALCVSSFVRARRARMIRERSTNIG